eukprot:IDg19243t1
MYSQTPSSEIAACQCEGVPHHPKFSGCSSRVSLSTSNRNRVIPSQVENDHPCRFCRWEGRTEGCRSALGLEQLGLGTLSQGGDLAVSQQMYKS